MGSADGVEEVGMAVGLQVPSVLGLGQSWDLIQMKAWFRHQQNQKICFPVTSADEILTQPSELTTD